MLKSMWFKVAARLGRFVPRFRLSRVYRQIFPPLMAMLILTGLVSLTVYQVTETWEQEIRKLNRYVNQTLFLNNVRLSLVRLEKIKETAPDKAQIGWESLKYQVKVFSHQDDALPEVANLYAFMSDNRNLSHIDDVFTNPNLRQHSSDIHDKLYALQQYTSFVTQGVTISLMALGVILTVVTILDLGRLFSNLEDSRDLNIRLQEEERRRIAQDLHDGVIQELVDLKRAYAPEKVDVLVSSIRRICNNLKPQILEDIGFSAALESLAQELRTQEGLQVSLSYEEDELKHLPKEYELPLFRVIQEVINNIKKHSQCHKVRLSLVFDAEEHPDFRVLVSDDGVGFDVRTVKRGLGLLGIQERIDRLGGQLVLETAPGQGCRYQFSFPIQSG